MLKEFKNGNLTIDLRKDIKNNYYDIKNNNWIDKFYDEELSMYDYYFFNINDEMYLVNYRTHFIYDFSNSFKNVLLYLLDLLEENNYKIKLEPLNKELEKELFKDLDKELQLGDLF